VAATVEAGGSTATLAVVGCSKFRPGWGLLAPTEGGRNQPKTGPKQRRAEEEEQDMVAAAGRRRP